MTPATARKRRCTWKKSSGGGRSACWNTGGRSSFTSNPSRRHDFARRIEELGVTLGRIERRVGARVGDHREERPRSVADSRRNSIAWSVIHCVGCSAASYGNKRMPSARGSGEALGRQASAGSRPRLPARSRRIASGARTSARPRNRGAPLSAKNASCRKGRFRSPPRTAHVRASSSRP